MATGPLPEEEITSMLLLVQGVRTPLKCSVVPKLEALFGMTLWEHLRLEARTHARHVDALLEGSTPARSS